MTKNLFLILISLAININLGFSQTSLGAKNDFFSTTPINSVTGGTTASVLANDTINGIPNSANVSNVNLTWLSPEPPGLTFNSNGTITVAPGTAPDNYLISYQICGTINTTLCSAAYATVYVDNDSDSDGITDLADGDDDNDGILDANECNTDLFAIYEPNNFTDNTKFLRIRPSDFGFTTPGATNLNGTHDFSSFFGLPAGSVIATVENVNVHPSADEFFVADVPGTSAKTRIKMSGTTGVYMVLEHGQEYLGQVERGISFLDGTTPATGLFDLGTQTTGGNWQGGNIDQYYYVRHTVSSHENAMLVYASINSQINPKHIEFSTNNTEATEYSTFFVRIFPECDYDRDGIPNRLDLDSDNDGCPDALEGSGTYDYSHVTSAAGTVSSGPGSTAPDLNFCADNSCVDVNGVTLIAGAGGQSAGTAYNENVIAASCMILLPVDLLSFTVSGSGNMVKLEWTASAEHNNKGFEIERSIDCSTWKKISFVHSRAQHSSSNVKTDYSFTDDAPLSGKVFYRLKQVDFDGRYEYSDVRWVISGGNNNIQVYPNPAKTHINITGLEKNEIIEMYDLTGRKVKSFKNNSTAAIISLHDVSEGVYYLHITGAEGTRKLKSFIKAR